MFRDIYADVTCEQLENGLSVYVKEWPSVSWFCTGVVIHASAREDRLLAHEFFLRTTPRSSLIWEEPVKSNSWKMCFMGRV